MAEIITMPRLSDTMTEGKVAKWHKKVGDPIKEGDVLAEIETDKAVQDFEAENSGVLLHIGVSEGESAAVDSILAVIGNADENISSILENTKQAEKEATKPASQETQEVQETQELPKGVEIISMPRLSDTMTEGKVAKWHKKVGDKVKEGNLLAEIETDKAVQDFESEYNGVLLKIGVEEGNATQVDSLLAIIGPEGTDVSNLQTPFSKIGSSTEKQESSTKEPSIDTMPTTKTIESTSTRIAISPLAKKMASEKGIEIKNVTGTGENGRIVRKDIENYHPVPSAETHNAETKAPSQAVVNFIAGETTETVNSQMRNVIAKRLSESKFTAPHYYLMIEVSMDKAIEARKEMNAVLDTKISFNDMVIKAAAMALRKHPQVNSSWAGEKTIHHGNINIGVAVAVPDGLVVPVLKNTDFMSYSQISESVKDLASRAKTKALKANEMEGSTFSISNLGMFGIETFTSIINQPNSAILSIGAIVEKPVVKDGQIVIGSTMKISMACDHRVIDGATGAQFLQTFKTYLEQPLTMLI